MRALTIGNAMMDTIAIVANDRIERMSVRNADQSFLLLDDQRKTEALEISMHVGGGAVNAAVALSRIGLDAALLSKLGKDQRADTILSHLMHEGVSTRWVLRDARAPTGASVFVSTHERSAGNFIFRGANTLIETEDLHDDAFNVDLVFVSSLSNESADAFPASVERAKQKRAMVAANPGVRQLSSRGPAFLEALAHIDILAFSRAEAAALVTLLDQASENNTPPLSLRRAEMAPTLFETGLTNAGQRIGLEAFMGALIRLGPRFVVITDGPQGAFLGTKSALYYCPILPARVAGKVGAGDAFNTTFAAFITLGKTPEQAMRAATINAASVVQHVDSQTGLMSGQDLIEQVESHVRKLPIRVWQSSD
jgi:ribokinase